MERALPARVLLPLALLAASCGGGSPIPGAGPSVEVAAGAEEVEFGRAFPLAVTRRWDAGSAVSEWDAAALSPLEVRPLGVERREAGGRVEEVRRFRAHGFGRGTLTVPGIHIDAVPLGGGEAVSVVGDPLVIRVLSSVNPDAPGDPEFPPGPVPLPRFPWRPLALAAAVLAAVSLFSLRALSRELRAPGEGEPPPPDPVEEARRACLAALSGIDAEGGAAAGHAAAARALREWLSAARGLRTRERTTEEILAAAATAGLPGAGAGGALASLLGRCDLAKFAGARPTAGDLGRLLGDARSLVSGEAAA